MTRVPLVLLMLAPLPLAAQAWDIRAEIPFPRGQNLPQTLLLGTQELASGTLDSGHGVILSVNHRIIRIGPVLRFDWGAEFTQTKADGQLQLGTATFASELKQSGFGAGLNAQFWVPFTGVAGELGLIQRFQSYAFSAAGARQETNLSRTWLRAGLRWRLPMPVVSPYLAASYQQPLSKDHPMHLDSAQDLASYLTAQRSGQEFDRLWTFGVGVQF